MYLTGILPIAREDPYAEYGMMPEDFDTMMTKQMESEKAYDIHIQTEGVEDIHSGQGPIFKDPEVEQLNAESLDLETDKTPLIKTLLEALEGVIEAEIAAPDTPPLVLPVAEAANEKVSVLTV